MTTAERGYPKGRAKRAEIIDRATALFGTAGYRGASLREIATRCGISHPGLLHHFPSKEALLTAVLQHRDDVDVARIDAGDGGLDLLRALIDVVEWNAARPGIVELFAVLSAEATAADHPAHAYFVERYRVVVAATTSAFETAQRNGQLREGVEPAEAARGLVALMDGLQVQWLMDGGATDMVGIVRRSLQGLLIPARRPAATMGPWLTCGCSDR